MTPEESSRFWSLVLFVFGGFMLAAFIGWINGNAD